jgi:chromosome segregation ATPase
MEDLTLWILIFAGGAIGLLGVFLTASERELKKTRREVESLVARLENGSKIVILDNPVEAQPLDSEVATASQGREQELQDRIAYLTSELEASQKSVEEFRSQRDLLKSDHVELLELRSTNQQLEGEISHLKGELQSVQARVDAAPFDGQTAANDRAKLESVIADLQSQLESHRMREEELATARQRLADYESHEPIRIDEQKNAQEQLGVLRQELCAAEEKIQELNAAHDRRTELERLYQEAKNEIRQLEEECSRWQERVAGSDDQRRRAAMLRQHLDELQTKQAALIERHRQFQNDLTAAVRLTEVSPDDHDEAPAPKAWQSENEALSFPLAITQADSDALNTRNNGDHEMQADEASATGTDMSPMIPGIDPSSTMIAGRRRRRFGIFPA